MLATPAQRRTFANGVAQMVPQARQVVAMRAAIKAAAERPGVGWDHPQIVEAWNATEAAVIQLKRLNQIVGRRVMELRGRFKDGEVQLVAIRFPQRPGMNGLGDTFDIVGFFVLAAGALVIVIGGIGGAFVFAGFALALTTISLIAVAMDRAGKRTVELARLGYDPRDEGGSGTIRQALDFGKLALLAGGLYIGLQAFQTFKGKA